MPTNPAHRAAALALAVFASVAAGCGATSSDKAGGTRAGKPVVLTMANGNGSADELARFAAAVGVMSNRTLRVVFRNDWRGGTADYEAGVIQDVAAGKADLGWSGSRAFDDVGVRSFDALNAPLLIDSYALEQKVLESPLAGAMLAALEPLGVVGLGILPGPMRKPLGVSRLVGPQDYRGKTIAISRSQVATAALRAMGATAHPIPSGARIDAYNGVETQMSSIAGNGYDSVGKYLTANVNLWPRPLVLFMNRKAFEALNDVQRGALRGAAANALPATLKTMQRGESEALGNLCRRRLAFVTASKPELAALRRAVQPVYDRLERDAQTRTAIKQIQTLRTGASAITDTPTCSNAGAQAPTAARRTPIDGVYRTNVTVADLRAAGASPEEINPENYGSVELTLNRGRFTGQNQSVGDRTEGTYTVDRDTITMLVTAGTGGPARSKPGEQFAFRWSLYRDVLTFKAAPGRISPTPMLAKPWRRISNAP